LKSEIVLNEILICNLFILRKFLNNLLEKTAGKGLNVAKDIVVLRRSDS